MADGFFFKVAAGMSAFTLFISCFLLGFSFDTIDPNDMGFIYDANVMRLETTTLYNAEINDVNGGRLFTGLGRAFGDFRFPRYAQRVLLSSESDATSSLLDAKTRDGLSITLSASFQYQFERTAAAMASLVINFGSAAAAEELYVKYARREIRDAISRFEMADLWQKRPNVTNAVFVAVRDRLMRSHATVTGLQLLSLDIPGDVQEAVQTTTVEEQKIEEERQLQLVAIVEVRTRQQQAIQDAEVTVIDANATSLERIIQARAAAEALTISVKGQETSLIRSRDALGFSNAQLLEYLQVRSVLNSNARTRIAVPQPAGTQ